MTVRRRQEEMLWRHSNQPLRQALLKKLGNKEPQNEQAMQCFMYILGCLSHFSAIIVATQNDVYTAFILPVIARVELVHLTRSA